jgi:hypothetical protein
MNIVLNILLWKFSNIWSNWKTFMVDTYISTIRQVAFFYICLSRICVHQPILVFHALQSKLQMSVSFPKSPTSFNSFVSFTSVFELESFMLNGMF